jgi:hypothetical protein
MLKEGADRVEVGIFKWLAVFPGCGGWAEARHHTFFPTSCLNSASDQIPNLAILMAARFGHQSHQCSSGCRDDQAQQQRY